MHMYIYMCVMYFTLFLDCLMDYLEMCSFIFVAWFLGWSESVSCFLMRMQIHKKLEYNESQIMNVMMDLVLW